MQTPITHLPTIAAEAISREKEHDAFIVFLKSLDTQELDTEVLSLNRHFETAIDCMACGNCCRSLMINVSHEEADALSVHLDLQREEFDDTYLEKGSGGMMIMNTIPCHFLSNNQCTVYSHRFEGCREFPGLHLPELNRRLFSVFMHYGRCPIIFNVMNALKISTGFTFPDETKALA